jgi:hypothetical protein
MTQYDEWNLMGLSTVPTLPEMDVPAHVSFERDRVSGHVTVTQCFVSMQRRRRFSSSLYMMS